MSTKAHVPQSRSAAFEHAESGTSPPQPAPPVDYGSMELGDNFRRQVDYCQRIAASKANLPGFGAGWRAIFLARLGPIFESARSGGHESDMFREFVLDTLNGVKRKLEMIVRDDNTTRAVNAVSAVLVRVSLPIMYLATARLIPSFV